MIAAGTVFVIVALAGTPCPVNAPTVAAAEPSCARAWTDADIHVNDIVSVGTHNSYKQAIPPPEIARLFATNPRPIEIDYAH